MIGISIREFARRAGCDDKVVRRKVKTAHLPAFSDGSLDPAYLDVDWRSGAALDGETQVRIAENEGDRTRLRATRQKGFGDYYGDRPTPITPGASTFGFGPHGTRGHVPNGLPVAAPFPPTRPESLPKAVQTLKSFDDIFTPTIDTTSVDAAGTKAGAVKDKLTELNATLTPQVNLAAVQALNAELDAALAKFQRINGAAGAAKSAVAGISSSPSGRGRSEIGTATANLSRSRQTNMTDRSYTG